VRFDRALLVVEVEPPGAPPVTVVNVHLRAPIAARVPGQKLDALTWRTVGGWAEGYFLAAMRRAGQALELRLLLDELLDAEPHKLVAVAGDFNGEDRETPLRMILGAEEETGNSALATRSLVLLDRALSDDRRWSVLHHGRRQMLDHVLASQGLYAHFRSIDVQNERLGDELVGYAAGLQSPGSHHAPVVVEFDL
jgi:predicted extracellular nuclease